MTPVAMTPEERLQRALAEESAYDAFDGEMAPDAQKLHHAVRALATVDAVPYLISVVEGNLPGRAWAVHALGMLGPAAVAAADALERAGEWVALFRVDEPRAREAHVHLRKEASTDPSGNSVRAVIAEDVAARGAWEARAHFAELLRSEDVDVVLFALDAHPRDTSRLRRLASTEPASVPVAELRALLSHGSDEVVAAAMRVLADLHLPSDAQPVLDVSAGRGIYIACAEWVAGLRDSEVLIEHASSNELYELVRRRRCAGLPVDVARVRARVLSMLAPPTTLSVSARAAREAALGHAAQIIHELRDVACADALVEVIGPTDDGSVVRFDDVTQTFAVLGPAGDAALAAGRARHTGERADRIGWVIDALGKLRGRMSGATLALADKYFADGVLEDATQHKSAYVTYAQVLARERSSTHAAFQLAWIDRGFGTPITKERVAWLRDIGVDVSLLDELVRRPQGILHGTRSSHRHVREPDAARALQADQAGLYSVAAQYYGLKTRDGMRCLDQTRGHLARVRGGVR
jgi:hypothetical protein